MRKKLLAGLVMLCVLFSGAALAQPYIEDMNEYILDLGSTAIDAAKTPQTLELNVAARDFVLSLDAGPGTTIDLTTDAGTFQFYQNLNNDRGAVLRENNAAVWLYDETGTKMDIGTVAKNYQFHINLTTNTVTTYVDGSLAVYSTDERTLQKKDSYLFAGSAVESVSLKGGTFSNVKAYFPKAAETQDSAASSKYQVRYDSLDRLGIITNAFVSVDAADSLTRGQFAILAGRMVGINEAAYTGPSIFTDVKENNTAFSYIHSLHAKGAMVGSGGRFRPNDAVTMEEAVMVLGRLLGYQDMAAEELQGWNAYLNTSPCKDMAKGVRIVSPRQLVTKQDAVALLYNSLRVPMCRINIEGEKISFSADDPDHTLLHVYFGYREINGQILGINPTARTAEILLKDHTVVSYPFQQKLSLLNMAGTRRYFWITDDDSIEYTYPDEFSRAVYGVAEAFNRDIRQGTVDAEKISRLQLTGYSDYIATDSDYTVTQNGAAIAGEIALVGNLVRLDIQDNLVYNIELIGTPLEGGLVSYISPEQITYTEGGSVKVLQTAELEDRVITLLNGIEISYDQARTGMYFDYIQTQNASYLLFSDQAYAGQLTAVGGESITVDGQELAVTAKTVYVSDDNGQTYSSGILVSSLIGSNVQVLTDMTGVVRYISGNFSQLYYGVVLGGGENETGETEYALRVALVKDGEIETVYLPYRDKQGEVYQPEVSVVEALANSKNPEGKGVYYFTVKGGKIIKIQEVDWRYPTMITTGISVDNNAGRVISSTAENKYTYISPQATVLSLFNEFDQFDPSVSSFSQYGNRKTNGFNSFSFNVNDALPMADLLVFGAGVRNLYDSTWYFGVVSNIDEVYQQEEIYTKYTIESPTGKNEYLVPQGKELLVAGEPVEKFDVILYAFNGIYDEILSPLNTRKLSILDENLQKYSHNQTTASDTEKVTYTRDFFIGGTFSKEQNGFVMVSKAGAEQWMKKGSACRYMVLTKNGKLVDAAVNDLFGKTVYIGSNEGLIQLVVGVE